jgi:hypothetical protein
LSLPNRKSALIAVVLIMLLLLSAGFVFYLYAELSTASIGYIQYYQQSQYLNATLQQVQATTPRATIALQFTPTPPVKYVKPNTVTFLTGFLTVTNLTEIFAPALLIANFTVTHTSTNPNATIQYNWIPYQQVYLLKGIQTVEIPAGIFPLSIYNVQPGDTITLYMTATVQILWQPVNAVMAEQSITGYFTIYVVT